MSEQRRLKRERKERTSTTSTSTSPTRGRHHTLPRERDTSLSPTADVVDYESLTGYEPGIKVHLPLRHIGRLLKISVPLIVNNLLLAAYA